VLFTYFVAVAATMGLTEFWLCALLPGARGLTTTQAADERRWFWQSVAGRVGSLIVFTLGTGILYIVVTRAGWDKAFLASGGFLAAILAYGVSVAVDITIDEERKRAHAAQTIPTQA